MIWLKRNIFLLLVLGGLCMSAYGQEGDNFKVRGFHLDLRNEVMTVSALKSFINDISDMGMNTLIMEWEATYPYQKHATISNKLAYTRKEIKELVQFSQKEGIDLIPVQECFGHVQYILRHSRYSSLRVKDDEISQVNALKLKEDSALFKDLFTDMADMFPSKYIFIGGDETRYLGECRGCETVVKEIGKSGLYVQYMKLMSDLVLSLGKIPVMWADMLLKYPEAAEALPKETILVDWNYGWRTDLFGDVKKLQDKGFTFWGAPSLRSHPDNWYLTDWRTHFKNQRDFIPYARKQRYEGMIMTSWSTTGLYGYSWDVGNEVIDMEPIRNNYPLSGFKILEHAFAKALRQATPLNPEEFVTEYAAERYGLSEDEGHELFGVLNVPAVIIKHGKLDNGESIAALREDNQKAIAVLDKMKPSLHKEEFEHYRLMADLRDYYLSFKELQSEFNADTFYIDKKPGLSKKVEALFPAGERLDSRFYSLQKGFLLDSEIQHQNWIRNRPVELLYQTLMGKER